MADQGEVPPIEFWEVTGRAAPTRFCCGEKSIDQFIRRDARKVHSQHRQRVTCASLVGSPHVAGFVSLACVTEQIKNLPGTYHPFGGSDTFACLQLVWLGVDKSVQGKKIGTRLVAAAIEKFAHVGSHVGIPHMILVPISEDVKQFYSELGFVEYCSGERMFLPLQSAIEAVGI